MAVVAFDVLEFARQLEASGVPRQQAEAIAKGMAALFVHNFDALVTRDDLDARFGEFAARIELILERRFTDTERRFTDMEQRFAAIDVKFARVNLLLGIILVGVALPALQTALAWLS